MLKIAVLAALPFTSVAAQSFDHVAQAEILPGWRDADGTHWAAVRVTLEPGWKTYWRAPGDAGIPPSFKWAGSSNLADVEMTWPTPVVFSQNGLRSVGYKTEMVLPIRITPKKPGKPIRIKTRMDIGVCRDICVPQTLKATAELSADAAKRDPRIASAVAARPLSAKEAGVRSAVCKVSATPDGFKVTARLKLPDAGTPEYAVIETADPKIWVSEAKTSRQGSTLTTSAELEHIEGASFFLDRSALRFTVLGSRHAVDIQGCVSG